MFRPAANVGPGFRLRPLLKDRHLSNPGKKENRGLFSPENLARRPARDSHSDSKVGRFRFMEESHLPLVAKTRSILQKHLLIFDNDRGPSVVTPVAGVPEAGIPVAMVPIAVMPIRVAVVDPMRFGFLRQGQK